MAVGDAVGLGLAVAVGRLEADAVGLGAAVAVGGFGDGRAGSGGVGDGVRHSSAGAVLPVRSRFLTIRWAS